jgi:hypothetical protein
MRRKKVKMSAAYSEHSRQLAWSLESMSGIGLAGVICRHSLRYDACCQHRTSHPVHMTWRGVYYNSNACN